MSLPFGAAGDSEPHLYTYGGHLCLLESGQLRLRRWWALLLAGKRQEKVQILLYNHLALQIFEQQKKAAAEADLEN